MQLAFELRLSGTGANRCSIGPEPNSVCVYQSAGAELRQARWRPVAAWLDAGCRIQLLIDRRTLDEPPGQTHPFAGPATTRRVRPGPNGSHWRAWRVGSFEVETGWRGLIVRCNLLKLWVDRVPDPPRRKFNRLSVAKQEIGKR